MKLHDGTIISSNLSSDSLPSAESIYSADIHFKQGTVVAMYYPEEPGNRSKQFIEYDVMVVKSDIRSGSGAQLYKNCQVSDKFSTANNYEDFTLQPATKIEKGKPKGGSVVTILCIDGIPLSGKAVIVGGRKTFLKTRSKGDGQFYDQQFNGINITVNKDGEYTLVFNSPIDQDGKKTNEAAVGTMLKIDKDGKLSISDNEQQSLTLDRVAKTMTWTNGSETVKIDKEAKSISLNAGKNVNSESTEATSVKSGKDMTLDSGAALNQKSATDMVQDAGANLNTKIGANWQIQVGGNVELVAGGNAMIQAGGVAQFMGTVNLIGEGTAPCAAVGVSMVLTQVLGIPFIGQVITGSSTVLVGT